MVDPLTLLPPAHMFDGGWGAGWGIAMMAGMVLFWGLVIVGAVWLVRSLAREGGRPIAADRPPGDALAILDRRFAEGEIDLEQYRERRSTLEGGGRED